MTHIMRNSYRPFLQNRFLSPHVQSPYYRSCIYNRFTIIDTFDKTKCNFVQYFPKRNYL